MIDVEYKERLIYLQSINDTERAHDGADAILCEFLEKLGYLDLVKEYEKVDKWYA